MDTELLNSILGTYSRLLEDIKEIKEMLLAKKPNKKATAKRPPTIREETPADIPRKASIYEPTGMYRMIGESIDSLEYLECSASAKNAFPCTQPETQKAVWANGEGTRNSKRNHGNKGLFNSKGMQVGGGGFSSSQRAVKGVSSSRANAREFPSSQRITSKAPAKKISSSQADPNAFLSSQASMKRRNKGISKLKLEASIVRPKGNHRSDFFHILEMEAHEAT